MREWLVVYLKGFAMGAADSVPGVSGGTIALITGIYERLVDALAAVDADLLVDLARSPVDGDARSMARAGLLAMDLPFLVVLGLGIVSALLTLANVVQYALAAYTALTFAFFFGLILASPVVLADEVSIDTPRGIAALVVGAALAFVVSGLPTTQASHALALMFFVGALAICAMVLPGISGSLILLVIGQYEFLLGEVHALTAALSGLAGGGSLAAVLAPLTTLVVFALGALVGILTFARVVSWALDSYRTLTVTFLVGLMLGALRTPAVKILDSTPTWNAITVIVLVAVAVVGAGAVLTLDYVTGDIVY